jgi:hypothetical protein
VTATTDFILSFCHVSCRCFCRRASNEHSTPRTSPSTNLVHQLAHAVLFVTDPFKRSAARSVLAVPPALYRLKPVLASLHQ